MPLIRTLAVAGLAVVTAAAPVAAMGVSGAYLAGRHASFENDFRMGAEYYTRALALDPSNPALMEAVVTANVNLGRPDRAVPVARRMVEGDFRSQVANLVLLAEAARSEDFAGIVSSLDDGRSVGGLVDGLARAWATMGAGDAQAALDAFDAIADEEGLASFALYNKALALALVGDYEGADDILSGREEGGLQMSMRGVLARAQVLSQLGRNEDAVAFLDMTLGPAPSPAYSALRERLEAGETVPFDMIAGPAEGIGEVLYGIAEALSGETNGGYTLIYARLAHWLNGGNIDALLLSASLLEDLDQFDLATAAYDEVPRGHPAFLSAEMGRADALREAGKPDAAIEALTQLAEANPDLRRVHRRLGDTLRSLERHEEASEVYDRVVAMIDEPVPSDWSLYFVRGITLERTDRWEAAEADFRQSLALNPGQPQVLNYLGYSLVDMGEKLDEALDMIERAVAAQPDSGYIVDSLGWAMYRLGRYDEAITHMERAVELMPVDPIINDHLGDVYWAVGREMEARFQWRRALSFDPEPDDAERIRAKLERGLDAVLAEEGAAPLAARDDG